MKNLVCYLLIFFLLTASVSGAHAISVKTQGKLALAAILSVVAVLTKYLVGRDKQAVNQRHAKIGRPTHVIEFEHGFDRWRVEWYADAKYFYRNDVLQRYESTKTDAVSQP